MIESFFLGLKKFYYLQWCRYVTFFNVDYSKLVSMGWRSNTQNFSLVCYRLIAAKGSGVNDTIKRNLLNIYLANKLGCLGLDPNQLKWNHKSCFMCPTLMYLTVYNVSGSILKRI